MTTPESHINVGTNPGHAGHNIATYIQNNYINYCCHRAHVPPTSPSDSAIGSVPSATDVLDLNLPTRLFERPPVLAHSGEHERPPDVAQPQFEFHWHEKSLERKIWEIPVSMRTDWFCCSDLHKMLTDTRPLTNASSQRTAHITFIGKRLNEVLPRLDYSEKLSEGYLSSNFFPRSQSVGLRTSKLELKSMQNPKSDVLNDLRITFGDRHHHLNVVFFNITDRKSFKDTRVVRQQCLVTDDAH